VASLFADAVCIAKSSDGMPAANRLLDKFFAYSHEIGSPPRHGNLQRMRANKSESKKRFDLPMFPVYDLPMFPVCTPLLASVLDQLSIVDGC
jgi:hypothetical protein